MDEREFHRIPGDPDPANFAPAEGAEPQRRSTPVPAEGSVPQPASAAVPVEGAAPPRRLGALAAAGLLALGAALGGALGTAVTYGALRGRAAAVAGPMAAAPGSGAGVSAGGAVAGRAVALTGDVDVAAIYRQAAPAVVEIIAPGSRRSPGSTGTGFIFDGRGYILTNFHVVDGAQRVKVQLDDGTVLDGTVLGTDPGNDLAVVQVNPQGRTLPVLPLGDSDAVQPGEPAIAIGYPLGSKSVTAGVVSGKNRSAESPSGWQQLGMIQTDAALNPGNSGGPLLNARGEVIGVNAQVAGRYGGIGLAVPINTAKRLLPDLMAGRKVQHPWLGISGAALTAQLAEEHRLPVTRGVVIYEVVPGSPAAAAGLKGGTRTYEGDIIPADIILAVDGRPVGSVEELAAYLQTRRPGDTVQLTVLREGKEVQVPVTLQARPDRQP